MLLLLLACQRPPPAPDGLDASARHLLREFWSDDDTVAAGLTGFVRWFDDEGYALVGVDATNANADGFTLIDLDAADIAALAVDDDGRDLAAANGAIGVATFGCSAASAEALLVRSDQAVVFDDFDSYERTFATDRATFEAATPEAPPADEPIAPEDDRPELVLRTDNTLTVSAIGTTLTYPLVRAFRHGRFEVDGSDTAALLALSYVPTATGDGTVLRQNYGVEVVVDRPDTATLRAFAVWTEVDSPLLGPDSPLWTANAVNTTTKSAERMDALCRGEATLPDE